MLRAISQCGACCLAVMLLAVMLLAVGQAAESRPSFDRDVMAVLSKAGCNLGSCHGNANGKGGLKLSLRGDDPAADYLALLRQADQRRVNLLDPEASLILQKPTAQVVHQGGLRFRRDSQEYTLLRDWIVSGAPGPSKQGSQLLRLEVNPAKSILISPVETLELHAVAHFAGGESREVTALACYEATNRNVSIGAGGLVQREKLGQSTVLVRFLDKQVAVPLAFLPDRPNFITASPAPVNYIDELVNAQLRELRMNPSPTIGDATFIRRTTLDAIGLLPTAAEARAFVADPATDKRARLIDRLLARSEFAEHWALKWSDLLRNEEKVLDAKGVDVFYAWIRDWIAAGKPMDQFVRELVSARGSTYENPPANFYRANRDPTTRGESVARLFLGVRLQCARCHTHPYDRWTQDDYYNWAAVFGRIDYQIVANARKDKFDKNEFVGEQVVMIRDSGEVKNARTGDDADPKFLGAFSPAIHPSDDRLSPLADWLASPNNRLFVASQANFIWYQLLGRGLVEPIDDFRVTNPASNPPLLEALAGDFSHSGFDLRHLVRTIMNSRTYQAGAEPNETNVDDEGSFARAIVRRLPAETMLDAQCQVLGVNAEFNGYDSGTRAGQLHGTQRVRSRDKRMTPAERFLKTFGKPERLLACDCERSNGTTLKQAFTLIGDQGLNEMLSDSSGRLAALAKSDASAEQLVAELYWSALSRAPSPDELAAGESVLTSAGDNRFDALQDLAWAILNSKEFLFRH